MSDILAGVAEGLVVHPDDTLILRLRDDLSHERFVGLLRGLEELRERMPNVEIVCVSGIEQMAVRRSNDAAEGGGP